MDLGFCPRCAAPWVRGEEHCAQCGYVAIGAGLSRIPKKKKKKIKPYKEPGSATPMLSFTLGSVLLINAYYYKPWGQDWDLIRGLFGAGRHHGLEGDWSITESLTVQGAQADTFTKTQVASGEISFDGKESVKIQLTNDAGTATAKGNYLVEGTKVTLFSFTESGDSTFALPKQLKFDLAWIGPDDIVVSVSKFDKIFLRRTENNRVDKMAHMALDKLAEDAPDNVRGPLATIQAANAAGGAN